MRDNRVFSGFFSMLKTILNYIQRHVFLRNLALILVAMLLIAECSRVDDGLVRGSKSIDSILDRAEKQLDKNPVLTDSLMNTIDPSAIRGQENKARYALFYTAAEYKNDHAATSDSLIMIAVRFYSIGNNLDYRFLSNYYLGCVYLDLNRYTDAAVAFGNAEQLINYIENDFWKGLLYARLGLVFTEVSDYQRAEDYFVKSVGCYKDADKEIHRLYSMLKVGQSMINMEKFMGADSILRLVENSAVNLGDSVLLGESVSSRLSCFVYMNEPDSARGLVNRYEKLYNTNTDSFPYLQLMAKYYNCINDFAKSESYLEKAWRCKLSADDSIYLYYVSSLLADNKGQTEEAFDYYKKYTSLQNENLREVLNQPVLAVQKEQYKIMAENELLKYRHTRLTLMLCIVIFLLILVIVLVTYHYKKKRMNEQLYESLSVIEELSGKIEDLRSQVRVQFHERHDLSNRLYSMYFDSESQDKITKQQLNVTINSLIKDYTAPDSIRKLDKLLNESYDGIMERLIDPVIGLTDKELELFRYSIAGLSSKSVSVIIKESPQNIYQIKSRLLKKVRRNSEDLWNRLNMIW